MSITLISDNPALTAFQTSTANAMLVNQPSASLSFFVRYTGNPSALSGTWLFRGQYDARIRASFTGGTSTSVGLPLAIPGVNGTASYTFTLLPGIAYHVSASWVSGRQEFRLNGRLMGTGSVSGNTSNTPGVQIKLNSGPAAAPWQLSDLAMWNGYALTADDAAALRDGAAVSTIGTSATQVVEYTFEGTQGATPAVGDAGLKDSFGSAACDFSSTTAGWTGYYSPRLVFAPSVLATGTLLTSGSLVRFVFTAAASGTRVAFSAIDTPPDVAVNGVTIGQLVPVLVDPTINPVAIYRLPGGVVCGPTDIVTYTAPIGWAFTTAGITDGASGTLIANYAGRSANGVDALAKTFRPGMNFPWSMSSSTYYSVFANLRFRMNPFNGTGSPTIGRDGTISTGSSTSMSLGLTNDDYPTMTATSQYSPSYPDGYYAIGWDDLDPVDNPTTLSCFPARNGMATVTEVASVRNNGVNGVGQVRVYQFTRTTQGLGNGISVMITCPTKQGKIANVKAAPPWGFTFTPGTPCVLDMSDPMAIDARLLARFPNGLGSIRLGENTVQNYGVGGSEYEPEDIPFMSDVLPGLSGPTVKSPGCTMVRPWDPAVSPYLYHGSLGTPFQATLGAAITDMGALDAQGRLVSTITITDAATAPVMVGLMLKIDSEYMGVLAVNGTQVTVRRGSRLSSPTPHSTGIGTLGSVMVTGRAPLVPANLGKDLFFAEYVTQSPHGFATGPLYQGANVVDWPKLWETGANMPNNVIMYTTLTVYVTGPTTFLITNQDSGSTTKPETITAAIALNPANCYFTRTNPAPGKHPIEVIPALAKALGSNAHVGIPLGANDDLIVSMARRVRDAMPPGRTVYLETGNEPWNTAIPFWIGWAYSRVLSRVFNGPTPTTDLASYIDRSVRNAQLFRDAFNEGGRNRGGEICLTLNQFGAGDPYVMTYAGAKGYDIGAMAIAPYIDPSVPAKQYPIFRSASDAECIDLMIADFWTGVTGTGSAIRSAAGVLASYNATYGKSAKLYCYEFGDQRAYPCPYNADTQLAYSVSGSVLSTDTTITLQPKSPTTQGANAYVGDYLLLCRAPNSTRYADDEWVQITAINGDVLTVSRGKLGTNPSDHLTTNGTVYARTNWLERQRDMILHPNWRIWTNDCHALLQANGIVNANHYGYVHPWPGQNAWGVYHNAFQMPGKGDGSDGGPDNRLYLATPSKANTIGSGVVQDAVTVCTRGQAINEWTGERRGRQSRPSRPARARS